MDRQLKPCYLVTDSDNYLEINFHVETKNISIITTAPEGARFVVINEPQPPNQKTEKEKDQHTSLRSEDLSRAPKVFIQHYSLVKGR